jgi:hypothetical protein
VADAGPDFTAPVGTVNLDGTGSADANGDTLTFTWSFTLKPEGSNADKPTPNEIIASFNADIVGKYVVQLFVNDGAVDSLPVTVAVTVSNPPVEQPNTPPVIESPRNGDDEYEGECDDDEYEDDDDERESHRERRSHDRVVTNVMMTKIN